MALKFFKRKSIQYKEAGMQEYDCEQNQMIIHDESGQWAEPEQIDDSELFAVALSIAGMLILAIVIIVVAVAKKLL